MGRKAKGLDYKQFTSTVILSQNSFASFLVARQSEKSKLLEKLTGTEIYGRISQVVHQRTQEADKVYTKLLGQLEGISGDLLPAEELKNKQDMLLLEQSKQTGNQATLNRMQGYIKWYEAYGLAQERLDKDTRLLQEAQKNYSSKYNQQLELDRYDQALQFQSLYNAIVEKKESIANLRESISNDQKQLHELKQHLERDQKSYSKAQERLEAERREYQTNVPLMNKAHLLQGEISVNKGNLNLKQKALVEIQQEYDQCATVLSAKEKESKKSSDVQNTLKQNLQTISTHQPMIEKIDEVKGNLQKIHDWELDIQKCRNKLLSIQKDMKAGKLRKDELQEEKNLLEAHLIVPSREAVHLSNGIGNAVGVAVGKSLLIIAQGKRQGIVSAKAHINNAEVGVELRHLRQVAHAEVGAECDASAIVVLAACDYAQ